jgi:tetratricopeptide (TPR) repeat protein
VAEGLLGGLLGGEDDVGEHENAAAARVTAEAFAAAVAADEARHDPGVAEDTRAFLKEQALLLKSQREEGEEQRPLRLSHLRSQSREGNLRRFGQRIRNGMQVFTALIFSAIAVGLGVMIYDAFTAHSVVVDAFKAPSALAARGFTGDVVASGVLDGLQKLQDATRSTDKSLNTTSAWSSDVKIEVPETGVSIGEINRLLHQRFGHDLHIDGDLVQTESGGLALTVRGDGVPAKTFDGAAGDLDKLTTQAAEYIYGRSQPVQYAIYLEGVDRNADALAFIPAAYARADGDEARAKLAHRWANAYAGLNQSAKAAEKQRLAMSLAKPNSPEWWANYSNRVGSITAAEGEETGWRESHAFLSAVQAAPKSQRPPTRLLENVAEDLWDLPLFLASNLADAQSHNGAGTSTAILGPSVADTYALMHDPAQATRLLTASDPDDSITKAEALLLEGYAALDRGDAAAAVPPLEAFYKAWLADPNLQFTYSDQPCFLGLAYGLVGRMADAEPVFKKPGAWSRCYAFHGDALAHAGDGAGAERVWAEGLRIAPDLPQVYLHRGVYELDHGDLKAAEADLSTAAAKAPHYADPLKAWGDVLAKQGRWKEALAKYDEALKYAPAWTALHQARDAAARKG